MQIQTSELYNANVDAQFLVFNICFCFCSGLLSSLPSTDKTNVVLCFKLDFRKNLSIFTLRQDFKGLLLALAFHY